MYNLAVAESIKYCVNVQINQMSHKQHLTESGKLDISIICKELGLHQKQRIDNQDNHDNLYE